MDWRFLNFLKDKVIKIIAYFKKDIGVSLAETPESAILQFCQALVAKYYTFVNPGGFLMRAFYISK
jgi:hypothetical protein